MTTMGPCTSKYDEMWQRHVGRAAVVGNVMKSISSVAMDNIPSARASARVRFRRLVIVRLQCNKNVQGVMKQPRKKEQAAETRVLGGRGGAGERRTARTEQAGRSGRALPCTSMGVTTTVGR